MRQLKINKSLTNRSEGSLDKYLTEISCVPMVTTAAWDSPVSVSVRSEKVVSKKYANIPNPDFSSNM